MKCNWVIVLSLTRDKAICFSFQKNEVEYKLAMFGAGLALLLTTFVASGSTECVA